MSGSGSRGDDWRPVPKSPAKPERKEGDGIARGGGGDDLPDPCAVVETLLIGVFSRRSILEIYCRLSILRVRRVVWSSRLGPGK
jgi:hypothetical protein